jgi:hypothetical protein
MVQNRIVELKTREQTNRDIVHIDDVQNGRRRIPGCSTTLTKIVKNQLLAAVDIFEGQYIEVSIH